MSTEEEDNVYSQGMKEGYKQVLVVMLVKMMEYDEFKNALQEARVIHKRTNFEW